MNITELQPRGIWSYFHEVTQIPRPSKKEGKIIAYLEQFATTHRLQIKKDAIGNILILKPATAGYENRKTVILQSHMDMVCEKNSDTTHNFESDPIQTYIEDGWVRAKGTTLGADDGIGIAAQLALLSSTTIEHGALECLFTVDEETGLSGAFALQEGFLTGNTLLNLDSEDDGELFIGCAGGIDTLATFVPTIVDTPLNAFVFQITISGLQGGHSGDDINKGRANAIKLVVEFLQLYATHTPLQLISFDGGNLRNAIPREAVIVASIPFSQKEHLRVALNEYIGDMHTTYHTSDSEVHIALTSTDIPEHCWSIASTKDFLEGLNALPNGVIAMHPKIADLVETSSNLASVHTSETVQVCTSQRSSSEKDKVKYAAIIKQIFEQHHFVVTQSDGYPGWEPNVASPIALLTATCYEQLYHEKPAVKAIHAGLECGLFLKKYPQLDMVSFGPTIKGAHSPNERLEIVTVTKFWDLLIAVLKSI